MRSGTRATDPFTIAGHTRRLIYQPGERIATATPAWPCSLIASRDCRRAQTDIRSLLGKPGFSIRSGYRTQWSVGYRKHIASMGWICSELGRGGVHATGAARLGQLMLECGRMGRPAHSGMRTVERMTASCTGTSAPKRTAENPASPSPGLGWWLNSMRMPEVPLAMDTCRRRRGRKGCW